MIGLLSLHGEHRGDSHTSGSRPYGSTLCEVIVATMLIPHTSTCSVVLLSPGWPTNQLSPSSCMKLVGLLGGRPLEPWSKELVLWPGQIAGGKCLGYAVLYTQQATDGLCVAGALKPSRDSIVDWHLDYWAQDARCL